MTTVLHIEDNASNRRLMELIVRLRPHLALLEASTGRDGVALAQRHSPDLILLDKNLPDAIGDDVLAALQGDERTRGIPVIVISAESGAEAGPRLRAAGARDYIMKPIDVPRMLALLDGFLPAGS